MNEVEIKLSKLMNKSRQTIRFYAMRMIEELRLKRKLNRDEQQIIYGRCARGINRPIRKYKSKRRK